MTRPARAQNLSSKRSLRRGLAATTLALTAGLLGGCIDAPENACGAEKPCPSGQFCTTEGVCLVDEFCSGTDIDGDGRIDEAPAAVACVHPDHTGSCASNGDGCACTDRYAFDVDGDPSTGCERRVVGNQVGTPGSQVAAETSGLATAFPAFAVGNRGRVAWLSDGVVKLSPAPSSNRTQPKTLGLATERYVAEEGNGLALFELYVGDQAVPPATDEDVVWAVVAERSSPSRSLRLFVGSGLFGLVPLELSQPGIVDYSAPTLTLVSLGPERYAIAVAAYGRSAPTAEPGPLLWLVPLRGDDAANNGLLAERAVPVAIGGAGSFRADVTPILQAGPTAGTLQTILVGAPAGLDVSRSEVLVNTFSLAANGDGLVAQSTSTDRFEVDGRITSHLAFPANDGRGDAAAASNGLYLANLKDAGASGVDLIGLAAIGLDGRFPRSDTELDERGQPAVSLALLNLDAEALGFIGAGANGQEAVCMPVLLPYGGLDSGQRQIGLIMYGLSQIQRLDALFAANTAVDVLRVSPASPNAFWSAWTLATAGGSELRRGFATCQ